MQVVDLTVLNAIVFNSIDAIDDFLRNVLAKIGEAEVVEHGPIAVHLLVFGYTDGKFAFRAYFYDAGVDFIKSAFEIFGSIHHIVGLFAGSAFPTYTRALVYARCN